TEINTVLDTTEYDIKFNKKGNTIVNYNIDAKYNKSKFTMDSDVEIYNLKGVREADRVIGNEGNCIAYSFNSDVKDITSFDFVADDNATLDQDIIGNVSTDMVTLYVPDGTDVTSLVAAFTITGVELKISATSQNSGITANNFTNPIIYTVYAADGSTKDYTITVNILPATPPNANNVRIIASDSEGVVSPIAWDTSTLTGAYSYIANENGNEDSSLYEWWKSDTENGTFEKIVGESGISISGSGLENKWIIFKIKPFAINGTSGSWVSSDPIQVFLDEDNPFWKKIVEDLWYINAEDDEKDQFDTDYGSDYEDELKVITMDEACNVDSNIVERTINISGSSATGNLYMAIDVEDYVQSVDSYKINFDTILYREDDVTTWGWGLGFNSEINPTGNTTGVLYKDKGYLFQFDPGASGFVVRRNDPSHRVIKWMGANSDSVPLSPVGSYGSPYRPSNLVNDEFNWSGGNDKNNPLWWLDYSTEIVFQKQLDKSYILKATTWVIPDEGDPILVSEPMWYGGFDNITLDDGKEYNGVYQTDSTPSTSSDTSLYEFRAESARKSYLGFRSWGTNGYDANFNNLALDDGFSMEIEEAYFLTNKSIYLKFDHDIRDEFRTTYDGNDLIHFSNSSYSINSIVKSGNDGVIITLDDSLSFTQMGTGIKLNIERGGIRELMAGDINITNGNEFLVKGTDHLLSVSIEDAYFTGRSSLAVKFDKAIDGITLGLDELKINNNTIDVDDVLYFDDTAVYLLNAPVLSSLFSSDSIIDIDNDMIKSPTSFTVTEYNQIVFDEDFENSTDGVRPSGWIKYSTGDVEATNNVTHSGNLSLLKIDNNDPKGGYKDLNKTSINNGYIFDGWIYRPSIPTGGGAQDRFSISNDNVSGYGIAFTGSNDNSELRIEKRNNSNASTIGNVVFKKNKNTWYRIVFVSIKDTNDFIGRVYDNDGNFLKEVTATDNIYSNFTRFYVHGGNEFSLDDLSIGIFK
ncbi:hypothetical protein QUF55_08790, partial [Clostridiaceae bacterium HSG29]|nr:hypothetical protein [Clostridiaceae bacterium HSG29]